MEVDYARKGVAGAGLGLGIAGTALGLLNGGGGILNLGGRNNNCGCGDSIPASYLMHMGAWNAGSCNENTHVTRYEASQNARIAELETEVKLRDANVFTMGEMGKLRDYMETRLRGIEGQICQQSVVNAQVTANLSCMQGQIATLMGLTKTVIPITSVCPEPMPAYNSWTAPTATT